MNYPKITIVTPSLNQGKYIEQTICSVLDQGYPNLEYIIIDGGSTDNTIDIIRKYESKITYWISEPDLGQADAINKGLSIATGSIFNWINSDDYLAPGALNFIGTYFYQNPDKYVLCGYTHCFYDEDNQTSHTYRMGIEESVTDTVINVKMNQPGTFYNLDVVTSLGLLNTSLRYVFDNELWFRFLYKYGLSRVDTCRFLFSHFRLHESSKTVADGYELFENESQAIIYWLSVKFKISDPLFSLISAEKRSLNYSSNEWDNIFFDVNKFQDSLSAKYMISLLSFGYFNLARKGFCYKFKRGKLKVDKMHFSAFFRLFLFPGYFK